MHTLFYLGIIFVLGALVEWLSPKLGLPKVVGYLMLGLLIGPQILGLIPESFVENSHFVIDLALSLIAVMIGGNLKLSVLKVIGKQVGVITLFEASSAFLLVSIGFYLLSGFLNFPSDHPLVIPILFGGLAAATAPAATIAVIHELKAKGNLTMTLLGVVALDDAVALILFAFAVTVGEEIIGLGDFNVVALADTFTILFYSMLVGIGGAIVSTLLDKLFIHHKGMETISTLGMVFIVYSLNGVWGLEPLFSALVMGIVLANISVDFDLIEEEIDNHLEEVIFMLFFILSAMQLKIDMLLSVPAVLLLYIVLRLIGKTTGAYIGAKLSGAEKKVQRYLGLGLVPQAGLAIGLALSLQDEAGFETVAPYVLNIIIATTIIHELIGPILTRYMLKKSQEA
ncbi:MAG: cation:proton antiporter [Sulfurimonadaceae bacterium]